MPISYDGKKLVPAPMVGMQKSYIRSGDGKKVGATFTVTLEGELLPLRGSPAVDGTFTIEGDEENTGENKFTFKNKPSRLDGCSTINNDTNVTVVSPLQYGTNSNSISYSLLKKTEAMRNLFSTEGKLFRIVSWWDKSDDPSVENVDEEAYFPSISGYPRIQSINFQSNHYNKKVPYTITLELDELMGLDAEGGALGETLGSEDFRNAELNIVGESGESFTNVFYDFGNNGFSSDFSSFPNIDRIYLSDVTESWSVSPEGSVKGTHSYDNSGDDIVVTRDNSQLFNLTHELSAVGKRAYGPMGLIREPWENARIWVESRLGLPSGDPNSQGVGGAQFIPALDGPWPVDSTQINTLLNKSQNGFTLGVEQGESIVDYAPYNYSRTQNIGKTNGSYGINEKWTLAKAKSGANAIEKIGFNLTTNTGTNVSNSLVINGEINGLETPKDRHIDSPHQTKYEAAEERFNDLIANDGLETGLIPKLAKSKVSDVSYPYTSKTTSKNTKTGLISFSYTFNDREQKVTGSISESVQIQKTCAQNKYAIIEVPGNSSGPRYQSLNTRDLHQATVSMQVVMGEAYRATRPSSTEIDALQDTVWDGSVKVGGTIFNNGTHLYKEVTTVLESEMKETWDPISGRYSKSVTYRWDGCDCEDTVDYPA